MCRPPSAYFALYSAQCRKAGAAVFFYTSLVPLFPISILTQNMLLRWSAQKQQCDVDTVAAQQFIIKLLCMRILKPVVYCVLVKPFETWKSKVLLVPSFSLASYLILTIVGWQLNVKCRTQSHGTCGCTHTQPCDTLLELDWAKGSESCIEVIY